MGNSRSKNDLKLGVTKITMSAGKIRHKHETGS